MSLSDMYVCFQISIEIIIPGFLQGANNDKKKKKEMYHLSYTNHFINWIENLKEEREK